MRTPNRFPELTSFISAVEEAYRGRLHGIYLFGSRARGDHRADSDYDVAVVLDDDDAVLWREQDALADLAYDTLHRASLYIQPVVFRSTEWDSGAAPREIVRSVKEDAVALAVAL